MTQPQSPTEYILNKERRKNTLFRVTSEGSYYIIAGEKLTTEQLHQRFPLANKVQAPSLRWKGENLAPHQKLIQ